MIRSIFRTHFPEDFRLKLSWTQFTRLQAHKQDFRVFCGYVLPLCLMWGSLLMVFLALLEDLREKLFCECERSGELQLGPIMALVSGPTVNNAISDPKNAISKVSQGRVG